MTPLMLAAAIGSIGSMKILIEARANLHLQDMNGQTALQWAEQRTDADAEMVETLAAVSRINHAP